jgi:hypothetical protein
MATRVAALVGAGAALLRFPGHYGDGDDPAFLITSYQVLCVYSLSTAVIPSLLLIFPERSPEFICDAPGVAPSYPTFPYSLLFSVTLYPTFGPPGGAHAVDPVDPLPQLSHVSPKPGTTSTEEPIAWIVRRWRVSIHGNLPLNPTERIAGAVSSGVLIC